jgi:hypothetical protein
MYSLNKRTNAWVQRPAWRMVLSVPGRKSLDSASSKLEGEQQTQAVIRPIFRAKLGLCQSAPSLPWDTESHQAGKGEKGFSC